MGGHTYAHLLVHVIFSTKGRAPLISDLWRERLHEYLAGIARTEFGSALRIGSTDNHLHGLLSLNTSVPVSDAICKWKSLSSKWVQETFPQARGFGWQNGYGVFSVSQSNAEDVIQYIDGQLEHHCRTSFEEEFVAFLERHAISYDPKYVFD